MSNIVINITPQLLSQKASNIRTQIQNLEQLVHSLADIDDSLSLVWEGESKIAFDAELLNVLKIIAYNNTLLEAYCHAMDLAVTEMTAVNTQSSY